MINFISISSGSNGNCYYIGNEKSSILIDIGVGGRTIKKRLLEYDISIDSICAVLVTHDHIDHVKHLGSFAERYKKPVLATADLHNALISHPCTRGCLTDCRKIIEKGKPYDFMGIKITPFDVPHDATETVGYFIDFFGQTFTLITDTGEITNNVIEYSRRARHLIIESNYDSQMLTCGNYPTYLINRIKNGKGHLCNTQTATAIKSIYHKDLESLFLCHLSENNNTPELAYDAAKTSLSEIGVTAGKDIFLQCLPRRESFHYKVF